MCADTEASSNWPVLARAQRACVALFARPVAAPIAVGALGAASCAFVWFAHPETPGGPIPPCLLRTYLGLDCPFCGGSRMMYYFLHGDIARALHFNALALVLVVALAIAWAAWLVRRWRGVEHPPGRENIRIVFTLAGIGVLWFVVRNLPFAPFTALYV